MAAFGIAVSGLGVPLAMRGTWSPLVIWLLIGLAVTIAGAGVWVLLRPRTADSALERNQVTVAKEELLALASEIELFLDEQMRVAPYDTPTGLRGRQANRMRTWERETVERFRDNYRRLALEAFDEAVRLQAVTTSSRTTVEGASVAQIKRVPGLFERAARRLERLTDDDR